MSFRTGEPPRADTGDDLEVGRFRFRLAYRRVGEDRGLAIHVFGPRGGTDEEVLRFDCFEVEPHYHLGWSYRDAPFIPISATDPYAWALEQIATRVNELLEQADAETMSDAEAQLLTDTVATLANRGRELHSTQA